MDYYVKVFRKTETIPSFDELQLNKRQSEQ